MYNYRATVLRVVDGDTVDLLIDLGFNISIKVRGRLVHVNLFYKKIQIPMDMLVCKPQKLASMVGG